MAADVLWGRDAELDVLRELLGRLPEQGGTLVLRGEAGVGKSALLAAVEVEANTRGTRVLAVTAVQAEFDIPFVGLDLVLRQLAGAAAPRGAVHPYQVAMTVLELLTREDRPLLLVVDDAQWLDGPSWEALAFVGRRLGADPVVLLMAMRDGSETEARLAPANLPQLRVEPLGEGSATAVLAHHAPGLSPDLRARVLAEAAGNPLGLVELAAVAARFGANTLLPAWLPLTTRLEQTFGLVVAELPDPTKILLLVAALDDGDQLEEILVAGSLVAGEPVFPQTLQPAISARLLDVDVAYRVRFRHPLVRSSVRQTATLARRRQVHAALAEVLPDRDRRVWHRAEATIGLDEDTAAELAAAADRARRRGAVAAAVMALERAAQLSPRAGPRASRLLSAAEAASELGDRETFTRVVGSLVEDDLPLDGRERLRWIREALIEDGWSGAARLASCAEIADNMRRHGDVGRALDMLVVISLRCWWSNPDAATRETIVSVAERLELPPLDPRLIYVLALAAPVDRGAVAIERMSRLLTWDELHPEQLRLLGTAATSIGAPAPAKVFLAASVAGLRDQGRLGLLVEALVSQAWTAAQLADTRLGLTAAAEARSLAGETGQARWAVTADLIRGHVEALRGNGEVARELADHGERVLRPVGAYPMLALVQQARGIEALAGGRHTEAYDHLSQVFDVTDPAHHTYLRFALLGHLAEAGTRCGRHDEVRHVVEQLAPVAARFPSPVLVAGLVYARAVLAPDGEAEPLFRAGLGGELASWSFERARLQTAYGAWLRRRRRPAESRPLLRSAIAAFDALGTGPWAERARRELRATGETIRRSPDDMDRLTPQEWQIAQLAADGLSNREIGHRLFLSSRTVSTHLYRIYPKVGVSSRTELARVMSAAGSEHLRHMT